MAHHNYQINLVWTGNEGNGTSDYSAYNRSHLISAAGKLHGINGSADQNYRGNPAHYNPEELFLSSIASCHMLWYLHLCAENNIVVLQYADNPTGSMVTTKNGSGKFESVLLKPTVTISRESNASLAENLHTEANKMCFIANSCNFEISHSAKIISE